MRQPLHGEYLQSQLQAWPWKQLLKGEAAEGDRSCPCSPFFAHGSTLLLPREEGEWWVGEHCLAGLAWSRQATLPLSSSSSKAASAQISSVFNKGCPAKKL